MVKDRFPDVYNKLLRKQSKADGFNSGKLRQSSLFDALNPEIRVACIHCGGSVFWNPTTNAYSDFCSTGCMNSSPITVERRRKTNMERFGMEDPNKHPDIARKKVRTFRRVYGVDNPSQADSVKTKKQRTFTDNYGETHWAKTKAARKEFSTNNPMHSKKVRKKLRATCLEKYGVENPATLPATVAKIRKTCLRRYGVENGGLLLKYKRKRIKDKNGVIHMVQGYEPQAIRWLNSVSMVSTITTERTKLPKIKYGNRTYYPDILVSTNKGERLIEVKGSWPLRCCLDTNVAKFRAANAYMKKRGGQFWLFYFTDSGKLVRIKNPTTRRQLLELLELK